MLTLLDSPTPRPADEAALRKQLDDVIGRAYFDRNLATSLLADPSRVLGEVGCTPQQHLQLRNIRVETLAEFARLAYALFWPAPYTAPAAPSRASQPPLAAAS